MENSNGRRLLTVARQLTATHCRVSRTWEQPRFRQASSQETAVPRGHSILSSSAVAQIWVCPSMDLAMAKLRSVAEDQQLHGLAKRLVLYLVPPSGGAVAFGATLVAAQAAGTAAGISCATPLLASLVGGMAVCSASAASAQVAHSLRKLCNRELFHRKETLLSKQDLLLNALFGVIAFKVLGGTFRNLMPSNIVYPGAGARYRASIPARGPRYANEVELGLVQDLYQKYGCHHCGKTAGNSIADHMPPNMIAHGRGWAKTGVPTAPDSSIFARLASVLPLPPPIAPKVMQQRFYPQCTGCSKIQSAALRHGKKSLVFHFRRGIPEAPYFTGFCIAAMCLNELDTHSDEK